MELLNISDERHAAFTMPLSSHIFSFPFPNSKQIWQYCVNKQVLASNYLHSNPNSATIKEVIYTLCTSVSSPTKWG